MSLVYYNSGFWLTVNQRSGSKSVCGFYFNFEGVKEPMLFVKKNINFNKNEEESRKENPTRF